MSKVAWLSPSPIPGSAWAGDTVSPDCCGTNPLAEAGGNSMVKSKHEKNQPH